MNEFSLNLILLIPALINAKMTNIVKKIVPSSILSTKSLVLISKFSNLPENGCYGLGGPSKASCNESAGISPKLATEIKSCNNDKSAPGIGISKTIR